MICTWCQSKKFLEYKPLILKRLDSKVHVANMGPVRGRQDQGPCWPHEPCYQGYHVSICVARMATLGGLFVGQVFASIIANINMSHKEEERQQHE